MSRIYLDNAATSFPKPPGVVEAVSAQLTDGASAGRGSYRSAQTAERIIDRCRVRLARLLNAEDPHSIVFTLNGTDGLNLVLFGWLRAGDAVVTSTVEHNSVLRPLQGIAKSRGVRVSRLEPGLDGRVNLDEWRQAVATKPRLAVLQHASNVTGVVQPVEEIARLCRAARVPLLVDAAQSVGHWPVNLRDMGADFVTFPGHKGLLGPLGTGAVWIAPERMAELLPLRWGGTGTSSDLDDMPPFGPGRFEAGNMNVPGLAGLGAALDWFDEHPIDRVVEHEQRLRVELLGRLRGIDGVHARVFAAPSVGVVTFTVDGFEPHEAAMLLDQAAGVEVRAGLHCAPGAHRLMGTYEGGGAVRASLGPFVDSSHLEVLEWVLRQIVG